MIASQVAWALLLAVGRGGRAADPLEWKSDLALWTAVVFLCLLAILWKFAWKPIAEGLDKRERNVADQIAQAEAANAEGQGAPGRLPAASWPPPRTGPRHPRAGPPRRRTARPARCSTRPRKKPAAEHAAGGEADRGRHGRRDRRTGRPQRRPWPSNWPARSSARNSSPATTPS